MVFTCSYSLVHGRSVPLTVAMAVVSEQLSSADVVSPVYGDASIACQ